MGREVISKRSLWRSHELGEGRAGAISMFGRVGVKIAAMTCAMGGRRLAIEIVCLRGQESLDIVTVVSRGTRRRLQSVGSEANLGGYRVWGLSAPNGAPMGRLGRAWRVAEGPHKARCGLGRPACAPPLVLDCCAARHACGPPPLPLVCCSPRIYAPAPAPFIVDLTANVVDLTANVNEPPEPARQTVVQQYDHAKEGAVLKSNPQGTIVVPVVATLLPSRGPCSHGTATQWPAPPPAVNIIARARCCAGRAARARAQLGPSLPLPRPGLQPGS
eukprot:365328-Chlamydomonas_euryale.AAC.14